MRALVIWRPVRYHTWLLWDPVSSSRKNGLPSQLRPRGWGAGFLQTFFDWHTLIPEIRNNPLAIQPVGGLGRQPDYGGLHDLWLNELFPGIGGVGSRHVGVRRTA